MSAYIAILLKSTLPIHNSLTSILPLGLMNIKVCYCEDIYLPDVGILDTYRNLQKCVQHAIVWCIFHYVYNVLELFN